MLHGIIQFYTQCVRVLVFYIRTKIHMLEEETSLDLCHQFFQGTHVVVGHDILQNIALFKLHIFPMYIVNVLGLFS